MAPRIDFYVLTGDDARQRHVYACRLVEKAYLQQHRVYVHVDTPAEVEALDELLWTFADRSFVPHEPAPASPLSPVVIGCGDPAPADLLVHLGSEPPAFYADYARVAEFVDADATRREQGRRRFAYYRDRGHKPDTHTLSA